MPVKIALVLLALWLVGIAGVYDVGDAVHILLLMGLMLVLLGFLKTREAAAAASSRPEEPPARRQS
jgi:hypothetical protein